MKIYIPTMGRSNQVTWGQLTKKLQKNATLVVPPSELANWAGAIPAIAHPEECKSIGPVRQWIVEQHDIKRYGPRIIMLDDDIRFSARSAVDTKKFIPCNDAYLEHGFNEIDLQLQSYPHAAIRHREMANEAKSVEYCVRALRALAYDVRVLLKHNIRFDRTIVMEDFDATLQLLRLGYPNAVYSDIIQNQSSSGAAGGCSTYRTKEKQTEGALALRDLHPEFVKVVQKTTKAAWGGGERTDVQIAWKKAFLSSGKELPC